MKMVEEVKRLKIRGSEKNRFGSITCRNMQDLKGNTVIQNLFFQIYI